MKVTKEQLEEKNQVKLEIEVDAEQFEEAVQKAYLKMRKNVAVPGFRKGKAPRKMIEKMYGEGVFYEEAVDYLLNHTYGDAVDESGIEPVDRPEIEVKQIGAGESFIYTATVTVKPEVELGEYKGISAEKVEYKVADEDVDAEINNMKERAARFVDITDQPVADGNVAIIDFDGYVDGKAFEGGKGENYNLTIGSGQFIPGFEEQLIGKNLGEETEVNVTFPAEYHAKELAGKDAVFKVKINGIKVKEYPELDDEFAKDVSEFDTFDELKKATRERLEENAKTRTQREQADKVLDVVTDNATVEIPEVMVTNKVKEYEQDMRYRISSQMPGITFEQYLEYTGSTLEDFREGMKDRAWKDVKTSLVLEKVAKEEKIEATDKDVEEEMEKLAKQYSMELDKVKEVFQGDSLETLKNDIMIRKTVDMLRESAKLTAAKKKTTTKKAADTAEKAAEKKTTAAKKTTAKKTATKKTTEKKTAAKKTPTAKKTTTKKAKTEEVKEEK